MDELDQIASELRTHIEQIHRDTPELRDLWLRVTEESIERVRKEDVEREQPLVVHRCTKTER